MNRHAPATVAAAVAADSARSRMPGPTRSGKMTNSLRSNSAEDFYCQPLTSQYSGRLAPSLQFV